MRASSQRTLLLLCRTRQRVGSCAGRGLPCLDRYSHPVFWGENHRPKLGVGSSELESHCEVSFGSIVYAYHPALLLDLVLWVDQQHRLAYVQVRLDLHKAAMGVDDLRHGLVLLRLARRVFRIHTKAHTQHHALAAPSVDRVRGTGHNTLFGRTSQTLQDRRPEDVPDFTLRGSLKRWPNKQALCKEIKPS